MRYVALFLVGSLTACASGEEKSAPVAEAGPDVPGIDISVDDAVPSDTTTGDDSAPTADAAAETSDSGVDTSSAPDTSGTDSTAVTDSAPDVSVDAPALAYRHTITIDGTNDFIGPQEKFQTTSASYDAYVTWSDDAIFVGYSGDDIGPTASSTKWLFVYLDLDASATTGSPKSEQYADQAATFPTGFGADAYFAWRTDGSFVQAKKYTAGAWSKVADTTITVSRSAAFVEMRIPFAAFGATPTKLGVVTYMLNEGTGQWTYAGLYKDTFPDGLYTAPSTTPITYWLAADLSSPTSPNATSNRKP